MLAGLAALLLLFWIIGLATHILGGFIHVVLIIAIIVGIAHFMRGKGKAV